MIKRTIVIIVLSVLEIVAASGCEDGGGGGGGNSGFYVGGNVRGLEGAGLVLQNNGGDDLAIYKDGSFTFATPLPAGAAYSVVVSRQPQNPPRDCGVTNGDGAIADRAITSIAVTCRDTPVSALFVGNSYTSVNNLPDMVAKLSASPESLATVNTDIIAFESYTWEQHAANTATSDKIGQGWDYVVLQDQSEQPLFWGYSLKAAADTLAARIRAAGAEPILFMTWPREYHLIDEQHYYPLYYNRHGEHLGAEVAPVGRAWGRSLFLKPSLTLHTADGSHPNQAGTYLAACVFYATITGRSPVGLSEGNPGLSDADRDFLQAVAWYTYNGVKAPATPLMAWYQLSADAVEDYLMNTELVVGDFTGPLGNAGGATEFDGATDFISAPYQSRLNPTEPLTFSIFAYRDDWSVPTAGVEYIVCKTDGYGLYQNGTVVNAYITTANSGLASFDVSGLGSGWHHFGVIYDGADIDLWLDGSVVSTTGATGPIDYGASSFDDYASLGLGARGAYPGPDIAVSGFIGALSDFRLYHQALANP